MSLENFDPKNFDPDDLAFDAAGLIPAVAQDSETREVLMLAWMNREALLKTIETGKAHYYSRSRRCLWLKGETSGHFQHVREILRDCDDDALVLLVEQTGAACHTGNRSCFYRALDGTGIPAGQGNVPVQAPRVCPLCPSEPERSREHDILSILQAVIEDRRVHPKEGSYTGYLFEKGIDKMLKKIGEESAEVIIAAKNPDPGELVYEASDLIYHLSVVLVERGLSWNDVRAELERRHDR
ncbi:MAG: bifunctional phosphoribosyl-AMP cyclohydrolase/phosphoribosyl-ATP diphosphatase HisIE [Synergistaceae bacterium]|jgi:phosphoribosyl-ATP pyrophosphohydrolase/phosphoribosyl-AMP cyclohydrolase|nr:bifunctional phosphoribosyl-AMP cyclohydrolase/phosphoribosyl-ATP diphosphatase HisIE [Synergistaceae bacterium]